MLLSPRREWNFAAGRFPWKYIKPLSFRKYGVNNTMEYVPENLHTLAVVEPDKVVSAIMCAANGQHPGAGDLVERVCTTVRASGDLEKKMSTLLAWSASRQGTPPPPEWPLDDDSWERMSRAVDEGRFVEIVTNFDETHPYFFPGAFRTLRDELQKVALQ